MSTATTECDTTNPPDGYDPLKALDHWRHEKAGECRIWSLLATPFGYKLQLTWQDEYAFLIDKVGPERSECAGGEVASLVWQHLRSWSKTSYHDEVEP